MSVALRVEPGSREVVRRLRLWARRPEVQVQPLPLPPDCLSFPHSPTCRSGARRSPTAAMEDSVTQAAKLLAQA